MPAHMAKQMLMIRQILTAFSSIATSANTELTMVAPKVCPTSRAVLCIPPAPPLRLTGVAITITMLFGVWNMPKPTPHIAIRHAMFHSETEVPELHNNSKVTPVMNTNIPHAAVAPGL